MAANTLLGIRIIYTLCLCVSCSSSCFVLVKLLAASDTGRIFAQQMLAFVIVEIAFTVWRYALPCIYYGTLLYPGDPPLCHLYHAVGRWLQLASVLVCALMALGLMAAVLKANKILLSLRWGPLFILPLALVLNSAYIVLPEQYIQNFGAFSLPYCKSTPPSQGIFAIALLVIFLTVLAIQIFAIFRVKKAAPASVVYRSVWTACKYMAAFICAYLFYMASQVYEAARGFDISDDFFEIHFARDFCYDLHAVFNAIAFWSHIRSHRHTSNVTFRSHDSVREISQVTRAREEDVWRLFGIASEEAFVQRAAAFDVAAGNVEAGSW